MAETQFSAGQLRERIRFERRKTTPDGLGNVTGVWRAILTGIQAKIGPTRGGEEVRAARLTGLSNFDIVVRSTSATRTITVADRVVDERSGKTFNVQWIGNLDERNRYLVMTCQQGGLDG